MKKKMQEQEDSRENTVEENAEIRQENDENLNSGVTSADSGEMKTDASEPSADKAIAEVRAIEEKLAEMQDKYLRLSAEFDNYRKRTLKEKMDLSKDAEERLLAKILPLMDDFDRAIQHIDSGDGDAIRNGISLIYTKFNEFLKQNGVTEIESLGKDFDVELHDAVAKTSADDESKKGKVLDVILKGYYLRDKILRHAKVVVGE